MILCYYSCNAEGAHRSIEARWVMDLDVLEIDGWNVEKVWLVLFGLLSFDFKSQNNQSKPNISLNIKLGVAIRCKEFS